jgi:succinate dehydrogenase/fumarate reductase flavoprotein subunit
VSKNEIADVVVVGFGAAGAAAAITAHDQGAKVIVLEKAEAGGGSTQASGGNLRPILDRDMAIEHFCSIADQGTPKDMVIALVDGLTRLPEWVNNLGGTLEEGPIDEYFNQKALGNHAESSSFPGIVGAEALGRRVQVKGPKGRTGGERLWDLLEKTVNSRGIRVHFNTRAIRLKRSKIDGRIEGLNVSDGTTTRDIGARAGVVLACGGFNWGADYQKDLFGIVLPALTPPGRNTGDGIRLAQDVGAQLWHMTAIAARFGFKFPGYEAAFKCTAPSHGIFLVDQLGRRFIDETGVSLHSAGRTLLDRDAVTGQLLRCPSFMIFDEATRLSGPVGFQGNGHNRSYKWSQDNDVEIKKGWIRKAQTMSELAGMINVPTDQLEKTASEYSAACSSGIDRFGRHPEFLKPVVTPPYYAVAVWPCLLNTQGGPRRNAKAEVLDVWEQPIPGLYSAGELGSLWGQLYPGAGNIGEALVTGQIAASNALSRVAVKS